MAEQKKVLQQQIEKQKQEPLLPTKEDAKEEETSKKEELAKAKEPPKKKKQQSVPKKVPKPVVETDQILDYSHLYKSFYDIFVGQYTDPKNFDLQFVVRDTRNVYAAFVNIMDSNSLTMKKKHQFDQAPTEKSLQDYYTQVPNLFLLAGKSLNDLELEFKNRGNEVLM